MILRSSCGELSPLFLFNNCKLFDCIHKVLLNINMSDNSDNIIDFFKHSSNTKGSKKKESVDSFPYIKLVKDTNGNYFSEESLREYSKKVCYIITLMRKNQPSVALYKYKVPQEYLVKFLNEVNSKNFDGELVDIEKYIPEDLA